jgi:hypothetical protein
MTARSWTAVAAIVYVLAWVVGLVSAPTAPDPSASDPEIHAFYTAHDGSTLIQALLVHGIAGIAFGAFVLSLARDLGQRGSEQVRWFIAAGLAAVLVSLVQLGIEIGLNRHVAGGGGAATTASLFHAVNLADTIKLALLGIAIAAGTRLATEAAMLPPWLRTLGYALLPVLATGGLAFLIDSAVLIAVLDLSLIGLLVWVTATGIVAARFSARRPLTSM